MVRAAASHRNQGTTTHSHFRSLSVSYHLPWEVWSSVSLGEETSPVNLQHSGHMPLLLPPVIWDGVLITCPHQKVTPSHLFIEQNYKFARRCKTHNPYANHCNQYKYYYWNSSNKQKTLFLHCCTRFHIQINLIPLDLLPMHSDQFVAF